MVMAIVREETGSSALQMILLPGLQTFGIVAQSLNSLRCKGNFSATSNNMKCRTLAVDGWAVTFGIQRGGDWVGPQLAQSPPRCTKCNSPPTNGHCNNHRMVRCSAVLMCPLKG